MFGDLAAIRVAYAAKVLANSVRHMEPLTFYEHMVLTNVLSESLTIYDATSVGKKPPCQVPERVPIERMPKLIRLIGRDSEIFCRLYKECREREIFIADLTKYAGNESRTIVMDWSGDPADCVLEMVHHMQHACFDGVLSAEDEEAVCNSMQDIALRELKLRSYMISAEAAHRYGQRYIA